MAAPFRSVLGFRVPALQVLAVFRCVPANIIHTHKVEENLL